MTAVTGTPGRIVNDRLAGGRHVNGRAAAARLAAGRLHATWRLVTQSAPVTALVNVAKLPTRLGWTVIVACSLAGAAGWLFSWTELRVIALFGLFLIVLAVRYTMGRAEFHIGVELNPQWASRGEQAVARVSVRNIARRRLANGAIIEVPVVLLGRLVNRHERPLPGLAIGDAVTLEIPVPTWQRGVVAIGPVRTVRGDPLGLLRREMAWSEPVELVVNPDTVPIGKTGAGLLRDLEGQSTNDRSVSDVAFHSLRDYVAGDDLRHVHAFTSARFGRPMVRQFVDTRTARLSILVGGLRAEYSDEEEFEMALSVGGSFAVRGVEDDQLVSVMAAGQHSPARSRQSRRLVLDALARAQFGAGPDLVTAAERMQRVSPDTSIAVLVTGAQTGMVALRTAANRFGPDVRSVAVRIDPSVPAEMAQARRLLVVTVPSLAEFGAIFGKGRA